LESIKNFFLYNIHLKILSLIIATVLWFAVLNSRNVEIVKEVPLKVITPQDLAVVGEIPEKIAFKLSGPKAFLRAVLNRKEEPIEVNFSNALAGITTYRFFQDNIQVPIGVKVLSVQPAAIVVRLEPYKKKEVPIIFSTTGEMESGYKLVSLELSSKTVKLKIPESKYEQIIEARALPLDLKNLHESGERTLSFIWPQNTNVLIDGETPKVRFVVHEQFLTYKIKNIPVVSENEKLKFSPSEVMIYVRCSQSQIKTLTKDSVKARINFESLKKLKQNEKVELPVVVELPKDVQLLKIVPNTVRVL